MQPTQIRDVPFVVPVRSRALWVTLVLAALGGTAVGVLDRWAQVVLPYPFADLANSAAVWALCAFAVGLWVGHRAWPAAAAGVVTLVFAVEAYYAAGAVVYGDGLVSLTSRPTQLWLGFALIIGALYGAAGTWSRHEDPGVRAAGLAFAPSVLFAESLNLLRVAGGAGANGDAASTAVLEAALGAVVFVALAVFVARERLDWVRVLACCVPVTALGYALYAASGYGG